VLQACFGGAADDTYLFYLSAYLIPRTALGSGGRLCPKEKKKQQQAPEKQISDESAKSDRWAGAAVVWCDALVRWLGAEKNGGAGGLDSAG
jgi:hypothetical protein